MMNPLRAVLLGGLALSVSSACVSFGDNSAEVRFHNGTEVAVNVYETDGTQKGPLRLIQSGDTAKNRWIIPAEYSGRIEGPARQIEATTLAGDLLLCRRFTYEELQRLGWMIEIVKRNDCT